MALNGKYVKIDRIIEGVFRDYGWTHEVEWINIAEWLGEFMDLVASPSQYISRNTDGNEEIGNPCPIIIKDYRGKLPNDMLYIVQARDSKSKAPMRHTTDNFHKGAEKAEANIPDSTSSLPIDSPLIEPQSALKDNCATTLTYSVNDCYIFTNFKEGNVDLSYMAFPVDLDGMPMIPDDIKYIQGAKAYVAEKIGQKLWIQGKMTADKFQYLQTQRDWYMGAATTAAAMPSVDQMESWKNAFVRLIPNLHQHATGFKYMGDPSAQYTHNSIT